MKARDIRWQKIKNYLRMQSSPSSVSEIHEALTRRMNIEVSRKTIERDLLDLVEERLIVVQEGVPQRFKLGQPDKIQITLTTEDLLYLLEIIPVTHRLYRILKEEIQA